MDKFKKTMVKSLAVILILAMCLGFAACEPKDDTVYQFEEAIENLYGKFKIKLEKNRLTEIDDVAKVSVLMTSAVRYDMTVGSFEEENDNEILMCKAIFTDNDGTVHELNVGTQGASDGLLEIKIRQGEKIRKNFYLPAAQRTLGGEKIPYPEGRYEIVLYLLTPMGETGYFHTDLYIFVQLP